MADEEFDGTNVILYLLGERQRGAYEARKALSQGVVESFDVVGFPCFFRDGLVALRRNDTVVHHVLVRVKGGVLLLDCGNLRPQRFGALPTTIAHMKRNNLATLGVHGEPNPLLIGLLLHKAPHFVGFGLKFINQYVSWIGGEPHMSMIGTRRKAFHHKVQQPAETHPYRTTDAA